MSTLEVLLLLLIALALFGCFAIYRSGKKAAERDARLFDKKPETPTDDDRRALQEIRWRQQVARNIERRRVKKLMEQRRANQGVQAQQLIGD
jgi:hypothetical protein